jgi:hypothetical protein
MRVILSIYLMLASAAGPWLCCCQAAFSTPRHSPAPAQTRTCCHTEPAKTDTSDVPAKPVPPCSCQHDRQPGLLSDNEVTMPSQWSVSYDVPASALTGAGDVCSPDAAAAWFASSCDDPRDLLRLLHILRC